MPACFQLTRKGESEPSTLNSVDEAIANHLGIAVHPTKWCVGWYDTIGFSLACGKSFADLREIDKDDKEYLSIINFLDENYTTNAFYQRK